MKDYTIYFEIFGKKMKTVITASSEDKARELLRYKIIVNKVEVGKDNMLDNLKNMFGMS